MRAAITVAWALSLAGGSPGASAAAPAAPAATIRAEATTLVITRPEASSREVATDGSLASSLTAQSGSRALHVNSVKRDQPSGFVQVAGEPAAVDTGQCRALGGPIDGAFHPCFGTRRSAGAEPLTVRLQDQLLLAHRTGGVAVCLGGRLSLEVS